MTEPGEKGQVKQMTTIWRLIDSGLCAASYNMALDEAISVNVRRGGSPPTLRLYGWEMTSVSLGSFQKITSIDLEYCTNNKIPVVRRPTGGRGILHGDELTYSFSSKNNGDFSGSLLETYRKLSIAFSAALHSIGLRTTMKMVRESGRNLTRSPLCFKSISYGEISLDDKKLIGSAQKRWSDGFLQQGSIPYDIRDEETIRIFNLAPSLYVNDGIICLNRLIPDLSHNRFKKAIKEAFEETFNIRLVRSEVSQEEHFLAKELEARKYLAPEWNLQR